MMEVASAGWKYVANASPLTKKSLDEAEEVILQMSWFLPTTHSRRLPNLFAQQLCRASSLTSCP